MSTIDEIRDYFGGLTWYGGIFAAIDLLIFGALCILFLNFVRKSGGNSLLKYVIIFAVVFAVALLFNNYMPFTAFLAWFFVPVVAILFVVIYRHEIKRAFFRLSVKNTRASKEVSFASVSAEEIKTAVTELVRATQNLSKSNIGGLIVFANKNMSSSIVDSGISIGARISSQLIESIFNTRSPLHDGAVVIQGNTIVAAGCFLPLTQNREVPKDLGTRHRAALGISENTDALVIVISEQTGIISVVEKGELTRFIDSERLTSILEQHYAG
ncbi:MAG: diadenylate cyclase [Firmicutes bacterium]|nr:diadenylate cyclase [Bacillota bacterium]